MFEGLQRDVRAASRSGLDALYSKITSTWAAGSLTDPQAEHLFAAIEKRRRSKFEPRRQRDRKRVSRETLAYRQYMAMSGVMPAHLACGFTTAELSVLSVIAIDKGICHCTIGEIADRAQVGHSTVQATLRKAKNAGLIVVEYRPWDWKNKRKSIIRVVSADWKTWIERGGSKRLRTLDTKYINSCNSKASHPHNRPWKRLTFHSLRGPCAILNPQLKSNLAADTNLPQSPRGLTR